jgi:peptidoglycan/LPS O-acetylase OafA/YrhL
MGVQLFFVISGFVIGALLATASGACERRRASWRRRMLWLGPPYLAALALALAPFEIASRVNPTGPSLCRDA